ncbi:DinB family protein [Gordonia metallireducens]|uniref:DinB family protein n=1 Tax=Gordonia metallireducens TaxID=2897779 RepID=UPI001E643FB6|nr:DinB family protein [Gordonia metallireducens]
MRQKETLHQYLADARSVMVWKLDGLSEYEIRRPLTPHGTNLLGLVKHLSGCEIGYFGAVFGRPFPDPPAWLSSEVPDVDMWAQPDETREGILDLYRRACAHADRTIRELELDATGEVAPWPPERRHVTLQQILVHMIAETSRHAGHADILRELVDGSTGRLPTEERPADPGYWTALHTRIEAAAEGFR